MISVTFSQPRTVGWRTWRQKCGTAQSTLNAARGAGRNDEVSEDIYKEQKEIYRALEGPFHGKCAYCETLVAASHPGDLDHFRPKNRVTSASGLVTVKDDSGQEVPHPGYYWLAYDWRNLLPACEDCNRPNKGRSGGLRVGKWDEFPVESFRARVPGDEELEKPLLLNPTDRRIKLGEHLAFNETGVVKYLTPEGDTTCRVFGLNLRQALVSERIAAYQRGHDAVLNYLVARGNGNVIGAGVHMKTMLDYEEGINPYSASGRAGMHAMCEKIGIGLYVLMRKQALKSRRRRL